ncbi:MAG: chemotaxis response regulator protein-glutamate methylesterase [Thermodesulfobacteriota bacterium]
MKIGIVNDSFMALESLRRVVSSVPDYRVLWMARNGREAVSFCQADRPDLVLMDLMMPVMDGVEATRQIMKTAPCAILVVTATVTGHAAKVFDAMGAGALDAVATPVLGTDGKSTGGQALLHKIARIASLLGHGTGRTVAPAPTAATAPAGRSDQCLIAIGCSTGGPQALAQILSYLPADIPASLVVIQHMDTRFTAGLVEWLRGTVQLPVKLAVEGDCPRPGLILVPSTEGHVVLNGRGCLSFTTEPADNYYHPSADVFFHSVVRHWTGPAIGVLLTGMGRDGADGLLAMRRRGWHTVAQDQASSVVYGMPKAAADLGAAVEVLSLCAIGPALVDLLAPKRGIVREKAVSRPF